MSLFNILTCCYLCHSRDMFSKEGPVFWWNLLAYRLMFLCLSFFSRDDNISFGWNFVREEWKRSPRWIRQISDEYSLVGKSWRIS